METVSVLPWWHFRSYSNLQIIIASRTSHEEELSTATQRRKGAEKCRRDAPGRPRFHRRDSDFYHAYWYCKSGGEAGPTNNISPDVLCAFASLRRCRRFYRIAWLSRPQESEKCSNLLPQPDDRRLYRFSLRLCASARQLCFSIIAIYRLS